MDLRTFKIVGLASSVLLPRWARARKCTHNSVRYCDLCDSGDFRQTSGVVGRVYQHDLSCQPIPLGAL